MTQSNAATAAIADSQRYRPVWNRHTGTGTEADPSLEDRVALCERMTDIAAAFFSVSGKELRHSGRSRTEVARVRQIAMYVTHVTLGLTMTDVGRGFRRDRTTVMHACHLIEDMRDDEDFDCIVARFEKIARAAFADHEVHP